jgi:hypothetical protein
VEGLANEDTEMQRMLLEKEARETGLNKEEITKGYHAYIDMRIKEQIRKMQIIREIEKRDIAKNVSTNPEKAEKLRSQLEDTEKRIRHIKESLQR